MFCGAGLGFKAFSQTIMGQSGFSNAGLFSVGGGRVQSGGSLHDLIAGYVSETAWDVATHSITIFVP